jgi:glycyl-tRNA synthetase (class II)
MKNWPKEDRYSWEKSEVMREFESQILSNYSKVEKIAQQKASKITNLTTELTKANTAAKQLSETTKALVGSADDGSLDMTNDEKNREEHQCNYAEDCAICQANSAKDMSYSDDEVKSAKLKILTELRKMADDAIDAKNIVLAYRIERTIAEIEDPEND